ncbi:MAG: condensation domain-containing protein [Thermoanaerobaculia bacterium]
MNPTGKDAPPSAAAGASDAGRPAESTVTLPASFAQQRLWVLDQLEPGNPAYNVQVALRLTGELVVPALEAALTEIVRRHEMLRTSFQLAGGEARQRIHPPRAVRLEPISLEEFSEAEQEHVSRSRATDEAESPFDLTSDRLFRAVLLRWSATQHVFILTMHHIVTDGWSTGVLFRELGTLYASVASGRSASLPELPVQYADFASWQKEWLRGDALAELLSYWRRQLGGTLPVLNLPTDRARPAVSGFSGARRPFIFPPEITARLRELGLREGSTLYMTLLAAFSVLLSRHSGQEDIAVGTPTAGRSQLETEDLIGFFINPLVLRLDLSGDPPFREFLSRVRGVALDAYAHQDLPFEKLIEALQPERRLSHSPLFQVWFVLQNVPNPDLELQGLTVAPLVDDGGQVDRGPAGATRHDLRLGLLVSPQGLSGAFEYKTELFEDATIESMIREYELLLRLIVDHPEWRLSSLAHRLAAAQKEEQQRKRTRDLEAALGALKLSRRKPVQTRPPGSED